MNNISQELVQEKLRKLPRDLRNAIFSEDMTTKMGAIAKRYGLSIDQLGELDTVTNDIILGFIHPRDYTTELSKNLNIGIDVAKNIAKEVNEQIFSPIRESLKKMHGIEDDAGQNASNQAKSEPKPTAQTAKSPFEQKLEEKVFKPTERPLVKEVEEARKENRYPSDADPYREPPKQL